jgi:uncharacterized protein
MKKNFILLLIIVAVLSKFNLIAQPTLSTIKIYHDPFTRTRLAEIYTVIKNTPTIHGSCKKYDEYGTLLEDKLFVNGKQNGISKTYYDSFIAQAFDNPKKWYGKMFQISNYLGGELNGNAKEYNYLNDIPQLNWERTYKKDVIVKSTEYYSNGKKKQFAQVDGLCFDWHENGQIASEYTNKNGRVDGLFTAYTENGAVAIKGIYRYGDKIGKWLAYHENGKLAIEAIFNDKAVKLSDKEFYETGLPKIELYTLNEENTKYKEINYDSLTGNKVLEVELSNLNETETMLKEGKELAFYSDGNKKSEVTYSILQKGNRLVETKNGEYTDWYENGNLKSKGYYTKGFKTGTWATFY